LIPECVEVFDRIIPKTVTINTTINANNAFIYGDPNQIAQVITNLALNSVDAMQDFGMLTISTSFVNRDDAPPKFRAKMENKRYVEIVISDTGNGMDDETLDKVFDPFFTTKEVGKGTGLGLSVVYGIIKAHNGYISCQSTIGEGTTFFIYLPEADQRPDTENLSIESDEHKLPTGYEGILIVDDEVSILEVTSDFLTYQGFQVLKAHSGEEAIEVYKREKGKIDIAVIDLGMPGMGGADCIKKLLEINPELKIVVASGYAATDQISYCKDLGAEAFVAKPFKIETLLKTVRNVLDK
jgi:CheY-like chemotaxis protein